VAGKVGVIAVRRVGLIVALGALLGMLAGAVTASPALARGPKWGFLELPPTFTIDPVFCGFEIQGTQLADKIFEKDTNNPDGSVTRLFTGTSKVSLTANGKTITENLSGPVKAIDFPDGSATLLMKGLQPTLLLPADAARFGLPIVFISAGSLTASVDANGNITSLTLDGTIKVDVCAALS
jgi:hypothetical protein